MVDFVSELWAFLSERKKLWLAPMLAVILVIGALLILLGLLLQIRPDLAD